MGKTSMALTEIEVILFADMYPNKPSPSRIIEAVIPETAIHGEVPRFMLRHKSPPRVGTTIRRRRNNVGTCMSTGATFQSLPYYICHPEAIIRMARLIDLASRDVGNLIRDPCVVVYGE
jgi:hypothetical protein